MRAFCRADPNPEARTLGQSEPRLKLSRLYRPSRSLWRHLFLTRGDFLVSPPLSTGEGVSCTPQKGVFMKLHPQCS